MSNGVAFSVAFDTNPFINLQFSTIMTIEALFGMELKSCWVMFSDVVLFFNQTRCCCVQQLPTLVLVALLVCFNGSWMKCEACRPRNVVSSHMVTKSLVLLSQQSKIEHSGKLPSLSRDWFRLCCCVMEVFSWIRFLQDNKWRKITVPAIS